MTRLLVTALASSVLLLGGCDLSSSDDDSNPDLSNQLTSDAMGKLLSGDDDFAQLQNDFAAAVVANRANVEARVFLGIATLLRTVDQQTAIGGEMRGMMQDSGILVVDGATFWDRGLEFEVHGQGLFKNSTPGLDQIGDTIRGVVLPALDAMNQVLASVPSNWEYVVPADQAGLLLQLLSPGSSRPVRFDYGDAQAVLAVGHAVAGLLEAYSILDWDGLSPNELDFLEDPNIDLLDVVENGHPRLGTLLRPAQLLRMRDHTRDAFDAYERAILALRAEGAQQQAEGVLSLASETFLTPAEMQEFLQLEQAARTWMRPVIDTLAANGSYTFNTLPDGTAIPPEAQIAIDFAPFFAGVDPRVTYLKLIDDPISRVRALGVTDLADLTQAMASFGGTVLSIGGNAPGAAVLQEVPGYALRLEAAQVPVSTKNIDGDFGDWASNSEKVLLAATVLLTEVRPDLGRVWVARDVNNLYVYLDEDLAQYLTGVGDEYAIEVEWDDASEAAVTFFGGNHGTSGAATFGWASGSGIECSFPIPAGADWAGLGVWAVADNATWVFDSSRGPALLGVR